MSTWVGMGKLGKMIRQDRPGWIRYVFDDRYHFRTVIYYNPTTGEWSK